MTRFEDVLKATQVIYPFAKLEENEGHTFLVDEIGFILIAFKGKSGKAVLRLKFKSLELLNKYYSAFLNQAKKTRQAEVKRKETRKAENQSQIQPNAIFYSSWGYEQTNISFFQIIAVKGSKVTLREIAQDKQYNASDSGHTTGISGIFIGDAINLRISL